MATFWGNTGDTEAGTGSSGGGMDPTLIRSPSAVALETQMDPLQPCGKQPKRKPRSLLGALNLCGALSLYVSLWVAAQSSIRIASAARRSYGSLRPCAYSTTGIIRMLSLLELLSKTGFGSYVCAGAGFITPSQHLPSSFTRGQPLPFGFFFSLQRKPVGTNERLHGATGSNADNDMDFSSNDIVMASLRAKTQDATAANTDYTNDFDSIVQALPTSNTENTGSVELWLDLRDTALLPGAALEYLSKNMEGREFKNSATSGKSRPIADRVILSEEGFAYWVNSSNRYNQQTLGTRTEAPISVLYVPSNTNENDSVQDLVFSSATTHQSMPCGKVLQSQANTALFNPIQALDIVMNEGGWILMEPERGKEEKIWLEEVTGLVTFLMSSSTSSFSGSLVGDNGILLSSNGEVPQEQKYATSLGKGVALACASAISLMEVAKLLLTQRSLPTGTTTSAGGILLPAGDCIDGTKNDLNEMLSLVNDNKSCGNDDDHLTVAIVLPLDIQLWQMAFYLTSENTPDRNEGEDCSEHR